MVCHLLLSDSYTAYGIAIAGLFILIIIIQIWLNCYIFLFLVDLVV